MVYNRNIVILYGSQTGTSQEVAERIWREAKRYHFNGPVRAMDDYPVSQLIYEQVVIFICSTTGQGEEPDNMKLFWKFLLRKTLPVDSLKGTRFAVLGLGDSSYAKFNYAAKKLHRRILQLGGQPLINIGLADDQHDLGADAVIDPWILLLWQKLSELYPLPVDLKPLDQSVLYSSRWNVSVMQTGSVTSEDLSITNEEKGVNELQDGFSQDNPCYISVIKNTRTTAAKHFQDVRLIQFSAPKLNYVPGDVLMVCPHNSPERVNQILELMSHSSERLTADNVIQILERDGDAPVPYDLRKPLTLRKCAEEYWDLNAIPRRYFFNLLSYFTTSDLEKEKLVEFTSSEGQEELYNYCNRPRRTTLEVLQDFPHATANIPLEYWFELLQPVRPRAFSIASSPQAHKDEIHILVAVVKYQTKLLSPRLGLCSNWLANLIPGTEVPAWIRKGSFKFSLPKNIPVIMIGPGTGVAPFRSYIHERVAQGQASNKLLFLFFGCRNEDGDFHCHDEWLSLQKEQKLSIFCAFSRDQDHKIYVQHRIKEQAALIWNLLSMNGNIFVAGNSKNMPTDVKEALHEAICTIRKCTKDEAEQFVKNLEDSGRYQIETWA